MTAQREPGHGFGMIRTPSDNARRVQLVAVPTPAEQAAFEERMARWLADVAEDWLRSRVTAR
jgi:hypothetical protein